MKAELHAYQQEMVDFCLDNLFVKETGAGLFADPGLGKTLVTLKVIKTLHDLGEVERVLVVAPKRVCKMVWPQEIEKWDVGLSYSVLCERVSQSLKNNSTIEIINRESLHKLKDMGGRWDLLAVDELTGFKNFTAKCTKSLRKILPKTRYRMGLTGTPVANSLLDLFAQCFVLDLGEALGRTLSVFRARYASRGGWQARQWIVRKGCEDQLLDDVSHLCLRMDAESNLKMPEKVEHNVVVEMPARVRSEYRRLKEELLIQLQSADIFMQNAASAYTKMRQLANGNVLDEEGVAHHAHDEKIKALREIREELWGKPMLVFYPYRADVADIRKTFGDDVTELSGSTPKGTEQQILDDWNAGKIPILACQIQTGSHGLNLQEGGCQDILFFGECDSLDSIEQAYRRVYRQGVKGDTVRIHRIMMEDSVDFVIRERLAGKYDTQDAFLTALKSYAKGDK